MIFPNEKIIYEVPIYSMSEEQFRKKWDEYEQAWYERTSRMDYTPEETQETVAMIMSGKYPKNVWKYNQIVGFVEIAISPQEITFNVQKTLDKSLRAISNTKHFIQDMMTNGMHFQIGNMENEELVEEIDNYLISIQKTLSKNLCLFLDTYNLIKKYIDFKGIHREIFGK